jgi:hypothetical protein
MYYICLKCLGDEGLKEDLKANKYLTYKTCDFCNSENQYCFSTKKLYRLMKPIIHLYTPELDYPEPIIMEDYCHIWEIIQNDWDIFPKLSVPDVHKLFSEMIDTKGWGEPEIIISSVFDKDKYFGIVKNMEKSYKKEWDIFCNEIIYKNRFFPQNTIKLEILEELLPLYEEELPCGDSYYRARICEDGKRFTKKHMGCPPPERSSSGRANPNGIPYLYLSSIEDTALYEVKPFNMDIVSIGEFTSKKVLKIIDLASEHKIKPFRLGNKIRDKRLQIELLKILSAELSKSINPRRANLDYIPLQYICEFIKIRGFDGLTYKSSLGDGNNLLVFNEDTFTCNNVKTYKAVININAVSKINLTG